MPSEFENHTAEQRDSILGAGGKNRKRKKFLFGSEQTNVLYELDQKLRKRILLAVEEHKKNE